ncbi:MAG: hypothetical protein HC818_02965 [Synechococcaceae cyanobacterium RM1_1_27]|nr:hypothetical protein [Synechococcaceae cyanobacterium RM1_1_27]
MEPDSTLDAPVALGQEAIATQETILEEEDSFASVFGTMDPDLEPFSPMGLEDPFDLEAPLPLEASHGDFEATAAASFIDSEVSEEQDLADLLGRLLRLNRPR